MPQELNHDPGYETRDIDIRKTVFIIIASAIVLILILVAMIQYFNYAKEREFYQMVLKPESRSLIELRAREDSILNSYGIIDSLGDTYRIPVDSAMQILLKEKSAAKKLVR